MFNIVFSATDRQRSPTNSAFKPNDKTKMQMCNDTTIALSLQSLFDSLDEVKITIYQYHLLVYKQSKPHTRARRKRQVSNILSRHQSNSLLT
jgi:hypothetical protein